MYYVTLLNLFVEDNESANHILLHCNAVWLAWSKVMSICNIPWVIISKILDMLNTWEFLDKCDIVVWGSIPYIWSVW